MAKITTLFEDSAKTEALYPRTKVSAVSDENNTSLEELLQNVNTDLVNLGVIADLDIDVSTLQPTTAYIGRTDDNTLNKPDSAGGGLVLMVTSNTAQWARVVYYSDAGMFLRVATSGIWHTWTPMFIRAISYSTATANSTYFSSGFVHYAKIGNIVIVNLELALKASVGSGIVPNIMSGLPAPAKSGEPFLMQQFGTDQSWRITVNADGSVQSHYDAQSASGSQWYGTFTYVAKEG